MAENAGTSGETTVQRLATEYGVATEYRGFDGDEKAVPEQTLRGVLTALGADVSDDDAARPGPRGVVACQVNTTQVRFKQGCGYADADKLLP